MTTGTPASTEHRSASLPEEGPSPPTAGANGPEGTADAPGEATPDEERITANPGEGSTPGVSPDAEEQSYEPVDPHPDFPDDFDGDDSDRESEEAVRKDP